MGFTFQLISIGSTISGFALNQTQTLSRPFHNGHQNAEIMHFRSEKVGSVRQFQLFLLIMHYLETTKPTVQVDIPF